jgi:hypothetical protein
VFLSGMRLRAHTAAADRTPLPHGSTAYVLVEIPQQL